MTELDKFKRRVIRSVARLLLQEKRPEEEVWEEFSKETRCDCKLLWQRMRALAIKKLKRLLAADDRKDNIASYARLSTTDWLLCDLVLVHENVDLIGRDRKVDSKALMALFKLVQMHGIEYVRGDDLANKWTALASQYNKQGRVCSLMLLQRRWYQLKEATRHCFYTLWLKYRGNNKHWDQTEQYRPTDLQLAIAKKYPHVITEPFAKWEELIEKKLVILPEHFALARQKSDLVKPCNDSDPDLVLVEPVIDTIDLGVDSDSDAPEAQEDGKGIQSMVNNDTSVSSPPNDSMSMQEDSNSMSIDIDPNIKIKTEPEESDGLSNVKILQATHVPVEILDSINESGHTINEVMLAEEENISEVAEANILKSVLENKDGKSITNLEETNEFVGKVLIDRNKSNVDEALRQKITKTMNDFTSVPIMANSEVGEDADSDDTDDIIKQKADEFIRKSVMKEKNATGSMDLSTVDDVLEIVDDGIEYVEEDEETDGDVNAEHGGSGDASDDKIDDEESAKFDLKLLMQPVVYTRRLDDFPVLKDHGFQTVAGTELIDIVINLSKPVSSQAVNVNKIKQELKIDNDLESKPQEFQDNKINDGTVKEEPGEYESDINQDDRIDISSYWLRKPKVRNYNPIQLCKNPDFNTRLKRLTVGFFSSVRNRRLLKACKPVTIDLHKAFEAKLIDGTLYLKSDGKQVASPAKEKNVQTNQTASVVPSAMPLQSLIDSVVVNVTDLVTPPVSHVDLTERKKVINLPDIKEIRRINQSLQTAEVSPIRLDTSNVHGPYIRHLSPNTQETDNSETIETQTGVTVTGVIEPPKLRNNSLISTDISEPNMTQGSTDSSFEDIGLKDSDVKQTSIENSDKSNLKKYNNKASRGRGNCGKKYPSASLTSSLSSKGRGYVKTCFPPVALSRTRLSWMPAPKPQSGNIDDFLLTIDTLNKMITKMNGGAMFINPHAKTKKPNWVINPDYKRNFVSESASQTDPAVLKDKQLPPEQSTAQKMPKKQKQETQSVTKSVEPEKNTLKPPVNNTVTEDSDQKTVNTNKTSRKRKKYCCWFRWLQERSGKGRAPKHNCPLPLCICCCKKKFSQGFAYQEEPQSIELSDEEDNTVLQNLCEVIENVVQQTSETPAPPLINAEQSMRDAYGTNDKIQALTPGFRINEVPVANEIPCTNDSNCTKDKIEAATPVIRINEVPAANEMPSTEDKIQALTPAFRINEVPAANKIPGTNDLTSIKDKIQVPTPVFRINEVPAANEIPSTNDLTSIKDKIQAPTPVFRINEVPAANEMPCTKDNISAPTPVFRVHSAPPVNSSKGGGQVHVIPEAAFEKIPLGFAPLNQSTSNCSDEAVSGLDSNIAVNSNENSGCSTTLPIMKRPVYAKVPIPKITNPPPLKFRRRKTMFSSVSPAPTVTNISVSSNSPQRKLLIDGSKGCPTPRTVVKDPSILYLGMSSKASESPIFLGKNKILLTTVKFPQKLNNKPISKKLSQCPRVIPSLPSLDGVQFILLPNGELTYKVDPEVTLDDVQLAALPSIMLAIKEQINSSSLGVTPVTVQNEVVKSDDVKIASDNMVPDKSISVSDEPELSNTIQNVDAAEDNEQNSSTSNHTTVRTETKKANGSSSIPLHTSESAETVTSETQLNIESNDTSHYDKNHSEASISGNNIDIKSTTLNTEKLSGDNTTETTTEATSADVTEFTGACRNLLSDLMEMSGISAEDTKVTPQDAVPIPEQPAMFNQNLVPIPTNPLPTTIVTDNTKSLDSINLPELSPITSLAELKYACKKNGKFFKLDFETGVIVPINVCIKKTIKSNPNKADVVSTIDLTDDAEESTNDASSTSPNKENYLEITVSHSHVKESDSKDATSVKPVKMFRSVYTRTRRPFILKKVRSVEQSKESRDIFQIKHKRKQNLGKVDVKIDLVDSDEPMEEEYLIDSDSEISQTGSESLKRKTICSSDDSSDDEPLATKFKRIKECNITVEAKPSENIENIEKNIKTNLEVIAPEKEIVNDIDAQGQTNKQQEPANEDEMDANSSPPALIFSNCMEDGQEDCILGF